MIFNDELLEKDRSPQNLTALQNLIQNDILGSIESNLKLGNISINDARKLKRQTKKLYDYIYAPKMKRRSRTKCEKLENTLTKDNNGKLQ